MESLPKYQLVLQLGHGSFGSEKPQEQKGLRNLGILHFSRPVSVLRATKFQYAAKPSSKLIRLLLFHPTECAIHVMAVGCPQDHNDNRSHIGIIAHRLQ